MWIAEYLPSYIPKSHQPKTNERASRMREDDGRKGNTDRHGSSFHLTSTPHVDPHRFLRSRSIRQVRLIHRPPEPCPFILFRQERMRRFCTVPLFSLLVWVDGLNLMGFLSFDKFDGHSRSLMDSACLQGIKMSRGGCVRLSLRRSKGVFRFVFCHLFLLFFFFWVIRAGDLFGLVEIDRSEMVETSLKNNRK